jgi:hypothetical protein
MMISVVVGAEIAGDVCVGATVDGGGVAAGAVLVVSRVGAVVSGGVGGAAGAGAEAGCAEAVVSVPPSADSLPHDVAARVIAAAATMLASRVTVRVFVVMISPCVWSVLSARRPSNTRRSP